jgi:L-alanine-DL-glutamate epimerase-like enolase superfamily enzyme
VPAGRKYQFSFDSLAQSTGAFTDAELLKHNTEESPTPILTGEDIYLKEGFRVLCENHAVDKIHPDSATSGGILETKKIRDMAWEYGVPIALHAGGTPVSCMATVHSAAATLNLLAYENHSLDLPWWSDIVEESRNRSSITGGLPCLTS